VRAFVLAARDGVVGRAEDLYVEDATWTVRYLVVKENAWLAGRQVLISPIAVGKIDDARRAVAVQLSIDQVKNSPPADSDKPVSRQYEEEYFRYYGWPLYWSGEERWGGSVYPMDMAIPNISAVLREPGGNPHLHSVADMLGYGVRARDGHAGEVRDVIFDDETWALRYIVVNTRDSLPGREVLVPSRCIGHVAWDDSAVTVDLAGDQVRGAPEYDPRSVVTKRDEERLERYYRGAGEKRRRVELVER
jgi:hypothetical protein